ncbi:oligosaccharide repeat unit polymerase family protein [Methanobrevibacter filiformis]|uniref:Oligosaccharide repeat unit polymerase n=1 Tax=Methanobrevibacter filiformis TaxID=55758 RepID=A0A162FL07_9EURY|nr:oligosaccharide repeat unit polymerase family protein [Methanobrevibacter filiformis]KZX11580.1 hypothetical protein MBFIL_13930 [Methanobrevibacter filiformis]
MSGIYSLITKILRNIHSNLRKMVLFKVIFKILSFFEDKWINSFFVSLYPKPSFLSFINKNKIISHYLFSPLIVIVVFAIFLLLSIEPISLNLEITLAIGFISYFIGSMIIPRFFFKKKKNIINFSMKDIYSIGFCLFIIATLFFVISIASVGGIPILKPSLRYALKPILSMPVFLVVPAVALLGAAYLNDYKKGKIGFSRVRFRFLLLMLISTGIIVSLGYRTPIIAILLIIVIMGYYGKIISTWEIIVAVAIGFAAIIGIGYFRSLAEYMVTKNTNPLYTLQSRADFTVHVLNLLSYISGDFGLLHGKLIASAIPTSEIGPRMLIGKLLAWRTQVTLTPTLIGPMFVDFGRFGVAIGMCLLGFIIGIGHKIIRLSKNPFYIGLYALLLTYAILGVETGLLDIQVLGYYAIGVVIYLLCILKNTSLYDKLSKSIFS